MSLLQVTRKIEIPDTLRISRYRRAPELGPRLLFFSGGTALTGISSRLKRYTHNSIHFVTPFDSGGSSAILRDAFNMPAIGDLRSRLISLADESITGHPEVYRLFTYRFSKNSGHKDLLNRLEDMVSGKEPMVRVIPNPMRRLIRTQLGYFLAQMPHNFELRGASIGNLILAGGYFNNHRHLDPIIYLFSMLVGAKGTVRAIINKNLHLVARLENGESIIGQHKLTGKEVKPIDSKITELLLSDNRNFSHRVTVPLRKKNRKLIKSADLICYPPGSFYSSVIANLLPKGVGRTIADNNVPKVYIPNLGTDPEQFGMSLQEKIETIIHYLRLDAGKRCPAAHLLNYLLIDSHRGNYGKLPGKKFLKKWGIQMIDTQLLLIRNDPHYDPEMLNRALLSLT